MSTLYNRRRGAKANDARSARRCKYIAPSDSNCFTLSDGSCTATVDCMHTPGFDFDQLQCIHLASINRYCEAHQT